MRTDTAFVLTVLVLCYAVVSGVVKRFYIAPALIFIAFGMVLGPFGFGMIDVDANTQSFTILAQLALTVILFNQAAMLDLPSVVRRGHVTFRLLVIGIPLSIVLGTAVALWVVPVMPLWEAVCLAAIVAPTEVALIDALLDNRRIPERVRHALSVESGCYDGLALAAMLAAVALASEQNDPDASRWSWFAMRTEVVSIAVGLVIGVIGGFVIMRSRQRGWMSDTWAQLATLALALVCFAAAERLHGSGFVAAFAGGLAYSMMARRADEQLPSQVTDAAGQLLELIVFAMFGGYAVFVGWRDADWRVVLFAVVALFGVRVVAVSAALVGSDLPARSRLFIGWFGPRGIGTLVLGLLMIERGEIQQSAVITQAVVVTVTISLVVHSLTVPLGIRLWPAPSPEKTAQES
ncbi:MAG: sodium/hydrogen antiporter [Mycobacterium sp.]|nr:sodium/hydrogen antiporter [Mycobacterium sp.]